MSKQQATVVSTMAAALAGIALLSVAAQADAGAKPGGTPPKAGAVATPPSDVVDIPSEPATVTGRVTNASGSPEQSQRQQAPGGCVLRPDIPCEAAATIREIKGDQSPEETCAAEAGVAASGQTKAFINTSRSNIKRPGMAVEQGSNEDPASAAISTSRSNIKRPGVAVEQGSDEGPATAAISTSRSNIKHPGKALALPAGENAGRADCTPKPAR